jgi:hypothetical protein
MTIIREQNPIETTTGHEISQGMLKVKKNEMERSSSTWVQFTKISQLMKREAIEVKKLGF